MAKVEVIINPYKMFQGSWIPQWLEERGEISPGAKLVYARLARFAGKNGKCNPARETIAKALGYDSETMIGKYLKELVSYDLIKSIRTGLNRPNSYYFLEHKWMKHYMGVEPEQQHTDVPEQQHANDQEEQHAVEEDSHLKDSHFKIEYIPPVEDQPKTTANGKPEPEYKSTIAEFDQAWLEFESLHRKNSPFSLAYEFKKSLRGLNFDLPVSDLLEMWKFFHACPNKKMTQGGSWRLFLKHKDMIYQLWSKFPDRPDMLWADKTKKEVA